MAYPGHSYPLSLFAALVRDIFLLRRRDFHQDAKACIEKIKPPLRVRGVENIPGHGPCVITVNHYHREGFGAQWLALAIAALVPVNMHWIITNELMFEGKWYQAIGSKVSRILLKRIARVYGFTTMPPMPPRSQDVEARAASVRAVLEYVKRAHNPILGIAPEGYDPPDGILTRPASGVGRFGLLLSKAGLQFVPVGTYESDGVLHVHFGEPYELTVPRDLSTDQKDTQATQAIMQHIAQLMPVHLRGEFV